MTNQNTSTNQNTETFSVPEAEYEYKRIASMDLIDFSQQLQDCIKHGYELVLDNENSPVQLGTLLTCGVRRLVYVAKEESETTTSPDSSTVTNTVSTKQRKTKVTTTATTNVVNAVTNVTTA